MKEHLALSHKHSIAMEPSYDIFLLGRLKKGANRKNACEFLAKLLRITEKQASALLNGQERCVKKSASAVATKKTMGALRNLGIECSAVHARSNKNTASTKRIASGKVARTSANNTDYGLEKAKTSRKQNYEIDKSVSLGELSQTTNINLLVATGLTAMIAGLYALVVFSIVLFGLQCIFGFLAGLISGNIISALFFNFVPLILSSFLLLVLLRPVFPRNHVNEFCLPVSKLNQPHLFELIESVCNHTNLAMPDEVTINYSSDIALDFTPKFNGIRRDNYSLHIGFPFVISVNVEQFRARLLQCFALVAHPLPRHCLTLIQLINERLIGIVDETDGWLHAQEKLTSEATSGLSRAYSLIPFWILTTSQKVFSPILSITQICGHKAMQGMEAYGDEQFVHTAGAEAFIQYFILQAQVERSIHECLSNLIDENGHYQQCNNLIEITEKLRRELTEDEIQALTQNLLHSDGQLYSFQRPHHVRIDHAKTLSVKVLDQRIPKASSLFNNISDISKKLSQLYLADKTLVRTQQNRNTNAASKSEIAPVKEKPQTNNSRPKTRKSSSSEPVDSYFNSWFDPYIFWQSEHSRDVAHLEGQQRIEQLNECILAIRRSTKDFLQFKSTIPTAMEHYKKLSIANALQKAGESPSGDYRLSSAELKDLPRVTKLAEQNYLDQKQRYDELRKLMGKRLFLAISMNPERKERSIGLKLLSLLIIVERVASRFEEYWISTQIISALAENSKAKKFHNKKITQHAKVIRQLCNQSLEQLRDTHWPFQRNFDTVADFLIAHSILAKKQNTLSHTENMILYFDMWQGLCVVNKAINSKLSSIATQSEEKNNIKKIKVVSLNY